MGKKWGNDMLNISQIKTAKPGKHSDGRGLYLYVSENNAKSWVFRIQHKGKRREVGLGSILDLNLADAREKAAEVRKQIKSGIDPIAEKKKGTVPTFSEAAKQVHSENWDTWKNEKYGRQWLTTLETYAFPLIGDIPVDQVTTGQLRNILIEIWLSKPETAKGVRQRLGTVLDWCHASGFRDTEAPMRAVSKGLPKQPKGKHMPSMPWQDVPNFIRNIGSVLSVGQTVELAITFAVLTAGRSGEIRGALWSEIEEDTWIIPAERMKAVREHRVPLSSQALGILDKIDQQGDLIFPSRKGMMLSDMSMTMPLRRARLGVTIHGFRSSFRNWCAEATDVPREVAEMALAHKVGSGVELAYRRTDYLEKRRVLMQMWSEYLYG